MNRCVAIARPLFCHYGVESRSAVLAVSISPFRTFLAATNGPKRQCFKSAARNTLYPGSGPVATGRDGSALHADHDPT